MCGTSERDCRRRETDRIRAPFLGDRLLRGFSTEWLQSARVITSESDWPTFHWTRSMLLLRVLCAVKSYTHTLTTHLVYRAAWVRRCHFSSPAITIIKYNNVVFVYGCIDSASLPISLVTPFALKSLPDFFFANCSDKAVRSISIITYK